MLQRPRPTPGLARVNATADQPDGGLGAGAGHDGMRRLRSSLLPTTRCSPVWRRPSSPYEVVDGVLAGRVAWLAIEGLPPVHRRLLERTAQTGTGLPVMHFLAAAVAHFQAQRRTTGI